MDQTKTTIIAAVAASAAAVGGWFGLPFLQSSQQAVNDQAAIHVERARRLLHQYDPQLAYAGFLRDQLAAAEVDVDVSDPAEFAESSAEAYEEAHASLWGAFQPTDWKADPPRAVNAGYGNISGDVRSGIAASNKAVAGNAEVLADALSEVNQALAVNVGDASARAHLEANQLKAVILQQKGLMAHSQAALMRGEAVQARDALLRLSRDGVELTALVTLADESGIEQETEEIRRKVADLEAVLQEQRTDLKRVEEVIADLDSRKTASEAEAEKARIALDKLIRDGLNFSDPKGAEAFRAKLVQLNQVYTQNLRQAHMLEMGGYPKAQIDQTGDYLRGRYLENGQPGSLTMDKGLRHHRLDRDVLLAKIETGQRALEKLEADAAQLAATGQQHAADAADANTRLEQLRPIATEAFAELNRIGAEAASIEDQALKAFDEAINLFQQAARSADQWVAEGRERAQDVSPAAQEFSAFQKRTDDGWIAGEAHAEAGAARLAKAWVHYDRWRASQADAHTLEMVAASLPLGEADPAAEREKAAEAKIAGVEEIKQAMAILEKAHKATGKHWTVAAQSASTLYLLVLYGEKDYLADAISQYRNAVKGRESESFAEPHVARLAELERMAGGSVPPVEP